MRYTLNILGELRLENTVELISQLSEIHSYNEEQLNTYIEPNLYDEVELIISSNGGEFRSFSLIKNWVDKLKNQGVKIITNAVSVCYSSGFLILLLGDERKCSDKMVSIMNHETQFALYQNSVSNQEDYVLHQKKVENEIDNWIIENTKMTKELLDKYRGREQWLTYDECVELGIITPVEEKEIPALTVEDCVNSFIAAGYTVVDEEELERESRLTNEN